TWRCGSECPFPLPEARPCEPSSHQSVTDESGMTRPAPKAPLGFAAAKPGTPGRHGDPLEAGPPEAGEVSAVDASGVEAFAMGKIDPAPVSPMPENDDLGPVPEVEPGLTVHGAQLGELLPRAFLRLLAGGDARVHENVAVAPDERGQRA